MPDASSGPVPADEFDRELRELTEGTAGEALFIEPSAAERATGAVATVRQRSAGKKRGPFTGTVFLAIVLAIAGMLGWMSYHSAANSVTGASAASPSPAPEGPVAGIGPVLSGTISPIDPYAVPPPDPFAGTASDYWADGAAGIVAPAARPAGGFSRAQVAAAYATSRKLLIAANLDARTLLGGPPTAFAKLLAPAQRATFLAGLDKTGVSKSGLPLSTRTWVASFPPGGTTLVGNVIKVHGTMSARAVARSGTAVLAVDVNYLFGYVVESPHDPSDWARVVDHVYGSFDFASSGDRRGALEPWDQAVITNSGIHGCGTADGYIHPAYPSDRSIDDRQIRPVIHPYSAPPPASVPVSVPVSGGGAACRPTAGT
jgi:hypothetical protein